MDTVGLVSLRRASFTVNVLCSEQTQGNSFRERSRLDQYNTHTHTQKKISFVRREHIANSGSAVPSDIVHYSPERDIFSCRNKQPLCNQSCKIRSIKALKTINHTGALTPPPLPSETRAAVKIGHQLFIELWDSSTCRVWFPPSTPPVPNHCRLRRHLKEDDVFWSH